MKKVTLSVLLFFFILSATAQDIPKQVRVYQPKTDSYAMINVVDWLISFR